MDSIMEPAFVLGAGPWGPRPVLAAHAQRRACNRRRSIVMEGGLEPSFKARLKEETERPFARVREFVLYGSAASASVGAFISISRILAALSGVAGVQPLSETVPNTAVDLGVVAGCVALIRWDAQTRAKRLERMSRGAMLASLKLQSADDSIKKMSDFRGENRPVVVVGTQTEIESTLDSATAMSDKIEEARVVVVPVLQDENASSAALDPYKDQPWFAKPALLAEWKSWIEIEKEKGNVPEDSAGPLIIFVRKDGRVGSRSMGVPSWSRFADQIARLPVKDKYGKP